ncbi:quinone-dependent dihydroorotate dehydrogenase [Nocardioides aurantiacus]|uniref:Dihydroorotate dehydrogenase (quinone) n=1 Tax=Nocardioides aurantiacus TaxID=86796 RepID=A0A3N2CUN0_9ACTN|nr:quinone-dependent dihydroorotate dehydrogenase [Nocardioides aurantiacus]ROR91252.1 dihydroorotate oxidase A [Nocardioides aurantiacus]
MTLYHRLFDRVLVRTDAERAHELAFTAIRRARPVTHALQSGARRAGRAGGEVEAMGLVFPGVLGLAAGFDKNGVGIDALANLGFGSVEIGTVTAQPQPGNPRPRLARLPRDRAIVNRMGFNNDGAVAVARRLAERRLDMTGRRSGVPLGVNIGKTKVVPEDEAVADYETSAGLLTPYADYLVVNVSSPNTPGLRHLQAVERLEPLLRAVRRRADDVSSTHVPLLVKIAPDLADDDVLAVADLALAVGLDGVVATNTTVSRDGLASPGGAVEAAGGGGLSGPPLRARAQEVTRLLRDRLGPEPTIIGVGGITTVADALARLDAGADLLQGYTGFVYEGPGWARRINRGVARARAEVAA